MSLFTLILSLVLIIDPLGNIPIFASILSPYSQKDQHKIILRELLISLGILVGFQFLGELLLIWLDLCVPAIQIAGGIILFLIALGMIFPTITTTTFIEKNGDSPFIVPLSVPLIAGPSILAAIMAYSRQINSDFKMVLAIIIAWAVSGSILIFTPVIKKVMKDRALTACTRLMGLVLTFISIEMLLKGFKSFIY
ncbi:MAG: hypothetical protein S4CHLAM6_05000 [Chlamydiae bacterium]|nr:hypothetical protein [Chlamydiota bacterium]